MPCKRPEPCPRVTRICDQLYLAGLGGLSSTQIEVLLQSYAVTHLVICGRPHKDDHLANTELAVEQSGTTELHVAELVPDDPEQVLEVLEKAVHFIQEALEDDLSNVMVACSKGASRSVVVVLSYLLTTGSNCQSAFETVAACRWRIWPSALLVKSLLLMQKRLGVAFPDDCVDHFCRRVGTHAAWATAWHNGQQVNYYEAESAWDSCQGSELEGMFAACKQILLGKSAGELALYADQPRPESLPPHSEVTEVDGNLMLCGLGGLSEQQIADVLRANAVQRVILCGRPGRDVHVSATIKALPLVGLGSSDMHLIPVADSASENLGMHFKAAVDFAAAKTLVACRQGASRSATVAAACLMAQRKVTAAEGLQMIYAKRWRVWPNPGFVLQLLNYENAQNAKSKDEVLEMVGIRSAWAANQQNLLETGFGQKDLTLERVESFWKQACSESEDIEKRFERCKELALGVDLEDFAEQDGKRRRVERSVAS